MADSVINGAGFEWLALKDIGTIATQESTSHLKNTSIAQLRCCEPLQNAYIPLVCCAFSSARALSLNVICIFEIACNTSLSKNI